MDINNCLSVPDNDPRLQGAGPGMTQLTDGILYVRESDWLQFLTKIVKAKYGEDVADKFYKGILN